MTYKLALLAALAVPAMTSRVAAQTLQDAFQFSNGITIGNARSQAIGGATGALGGEVTAVYVNPAAAGFSRSCDVSFSTGYQHIRNTDYFLGNKDIGRKGGLKVDNFTMLILNNEKERPMVFTMGVNRVNEFRENIYYQGDIANSSLSLNYFMQADEARLTDPDVLLSDGGASPALRHGAGLAYETYLINPYKEGSQYKFNSAVEADDYSVLVNQSHNIYTSGGTNEVTLALGQKHNDKFALGGSFNIDILTRRQKSVWTETNINPVHADLNSFQVTETTTTNGLGVNFKFGAIYKPIIPLNLGVAIQSPTWYGMNKDYQTDMVTNTKSVGIISASTVYMIDDSTRSQPDNLTYKLTTPWKATGSAVLLFNTAGNPDLPYGFISADYELNDYSSIKLKYGDGFDIRHHNEAVKATYRMTGNVRVGGEVKYLFYALRLGYAHYANPYKDTRVDGSRTYYSGGIGYKANSGYYVDLSFVKGGNQKRMEVPFETLPNSYGYVSPPAAQITNATTRLSATFGVKF